MRKIPKHELIPDNPSSTCIIYWSSAYIFIEIASTITVLSNHYVGWQLIYWLPVISIFVHQMHEEILWLTAGNGGDADDWPCMSTSCCLTNDKHNSWCIGPLSGSGNVRCSLAQHCARAIRRCYQHSYERFVVIHA